MQLEAGHPLQVLSPGFVYYNERVIEQSTSDCNAGAEPHDGMSVLLKLGCPPNPNEPDRATATGRRDYAVLVLLARLGLRAGEVAALELGDFDGRRGEVLINGKGRRQEVLPLPVDIGEAVSDYLEHGRARLGCRKVFLRARAPVGGVTVSVIEGIVRLACERVGLPTVGPHRLRHTAATEMLRGGATLSEIGKVLRHRSQATTAIYAKVDRTALRDLAQPWPGGRP